MGSSVRHREIAATVAETIFGSLETAPERLPPLSDSIDLEALDDIVPDDPSPEVTVAFKYEGLLILVNSGNRIYVESLPTDGVAADGDEFAPEG